MFKKLFTKTEKETTEKEVAPIETLNTNEVNQIIGGRPGDPIPDIDITIDQSPSGATS
jgi:hypothetical protein